jgi:hypothetical protein
VAELPAHIVGEFTETAIAPLTVSVEVAVALQPPVVPVTVYVVVEAGFAVTEAPVVALRPVAGDQE